ncbi:hypothetical protein PsorP6_010806 [Peronosclerospora sorghi]|uniref:Uncharacterized protein n=1 Tax=Peronosclerospora sorghi TaxID=230839 RepID=A0ACC0VV38_9STRA|nr:hypothetical protein PsorP6_010806 [Peronosclerospora sorghi]
MVSTRIGLLVIAFALVQAASEVAANVSGKKPETAELNSAEFDRVGRVLEEDAYRRNHNRHGGPGH